jgi:hypothetical protein
MTVHEKHLCAVCNLSYDKHRTGDDRCPGASAFPKWPSTVHDEVRAGALFDKRVAKYWSQRLTFFVPKL